MLQSIWKLSLFANGVPRFSPFANGLTFQAVCKRPSPFVTRLDARDRFRLCADLTSLSIVQTVYRPHMCPEAFFIVLLPPAERKTREEGAEICTVNN